LPRAIASGKAANRILVTGIVLMRTGWRLVCAFVAAALLTCGAAWADEAPVPEAVLAALPELPDIVEGSPGAPATIIEYASLTCTHCAAFHAEVWPKLKAKYVDTGKARFILREFPLDPRAGAAFLLARCVGPDQRDAMIDVLLDRQNDWAFVSEAVEPMRRISAPFGLAGDAFDECVHNQTLYSEINESRDSAIKALDIRKTPTFFVNGRRFEGEAALEDFDRLLNSPPD
jgi:protein-disulfide isomerase